MSYRIQNVSFCNIFAMILKLKTSWCPFVLDPKCLPCLTYLCRHPLIDSFCFVILVGFSCGNHDDASFVFSEKITLNYGSNTLDMLSMMIGLQVIILSFRFLTLFRIIFAISWHKMITTFEVCLLVTPVSLYARLGNLGCCVVLLLLLRKFLAKEDFCSLMLCVLNC